MRSLARNRLLMYLLLTGLSVGLVLILIGPSIYVCVNSRLFGEQIIASTAEAIAADEKDSQVLLGLVADWIHNEITYDDGGTYYWPVYPFIVCRMVPPDPAWTMTIRRGACEEQAVLFAEMVRSVGLDCRIVHNPGEDHVWNEVLVNGSWTHVDVGVSPEYRFDDPDVYETMWGKQLSHVYAVDTDGSKSDVTPRYTNTGRLDVRVEKDGLPVAGARVIILSRFLMEHYPEDYKEPRCALITTTDASGSDSLDLGGNNYTIVASLAVVSLGEVQVYGSRGEAIVHLQEGEETLVTIQLDHSAILLSIEEVLSIGVVLLLIFAFFLCIFVVWKALRRRTSIGPTI